MSVPKRSCGHRAIFGVIRTGERNCDAEDRRPPEQLRGGRFAFVVLPALEGASAAANEPGALGLGEALHLAGGEQCHVQGEVAGTPIMTLLDGARGASGDDGLDRAHAATPAVEFWRTAWFALNSSLGLVFASLMRSGQ